MNCRSTITRHKCTAEKIGCHIHFTIVFWKRQPTFSYLWTQLWVFVQVVQNKDTGLWINIYHTGPPSIHSSGRTSCLVWAYAQLRGPGHFIKCPGESIKEEVVSVTNTDGSTEESICYNVIKVWRVWTNARLQGPGHLRKCPGQSLNQQVVAVLLFKHKQTRILLGRQRPPFVSMWLS